MKQLLNLLDECGFGWVSPVKNDNRTEEVLYRTNSKWLILSSCMFLIPVSWHIVQYTLYRVYNTIYYINVYEWNTQNRRIFRVFVIVNFNASLATFVSINYWRNPEKGWRRDLDLIVAKYAIVVGIYYIPFYVNYVPYLVFGCASIFMMFYAYYYSSYYVNKKDPIWIKYHILFHTAVALSAFYISDGIRMNMNEGICI